MAQYRSGDRYLSEEEHLNEQQGKWVFYLFLLGAVVIGYFVNMWVSDFDIPKWARFTVVILSGLIGGVVLGALHKQIQFLIGTLVLLGIVFIAGSLIWEIL